LLVVAHLKLRQFEQAEHYLRLYKQTSDSIQLVKEKDSFRDMIAKYESDKKKNMIASLERENTLKEKLAANQRNLIIALLTGLVLISAAGFLYFRNLINKRKLEKKLLLKEEELQRQKEQKLMAEFNKQLAEVQPVGVGVRGSRHAVHPTLAPLAVRLRPSGSNQGTTSLESNPNPMAPCGFPPGTPMRTAP